MKFSKDYKKYLIIFYICMAICWIVVTGKIGWESTGFHLNGLFSAFFTVLCFMICLGITLILLHKIKPLRKNIKNITTICGYILFVPPTLIILLLTYYLVI